MTTETNVNAVGLDVGTSRIVTARQAAEGITCAAQLNAFVDLPWSRLTLSTLKKEGIPHSAAEGSIIVHGTESARFADLLGVDLRRTMARGVLNPDEPEGLAQMRRILEHVVGPSQVKGQRLCFSVPAPQPGFEENLTYHEASLRQVLGELGYDPVSVAEGLAVVYAELESSNYTGIGISFGGGLCNVCLAYLSVPVASFAVSKAGDYIDASAASAAGELVTRMRARKEDAFYFNGYFADKGLQALAVYYDEMIQAVTSQMKEQLAGCARTGRFRKPVPVVLSGGSALPKGFASRFEAALKGSDCPVPVSEVRMAANPLETTARGALVAALSEQ